MAAERASNQLALLGDFGGTWARFALSEKGEKPVSERTYPITEFAGPLEAAQAYLKDVGATPNIGALSIAAPVTGDVVKMTNTNWHFSVTDLRDALGFSHLELVNDFTANALAAPHLSSKDKVAIGKGAAVTNAPIAVIGPGSGLGVGIVIPTPIGWEAMPGEGGHVTVPACTDREVSVINFLAARHGHVSAERLLSGPGLVNIYQALGGAEPLSPAEIGASDDETCRATLQMFFAVLGTVAGNLALIAGASGGVYVMGGIVPRYCQALTESEFRQRFEAKGRFQGYLAKIPIWVVTRKNPCFIGLIHRLKAIGLDRSPQRT